MTSDFILNYLFAKSYRGYPYSEKFKNKYKNLDIFYMDAPRETPGVSKDAPGSTKHTI